MLAWATAADTSSTGFKEIPGLSIVAGSRGHATITVSGRFSGAPVALRVIAGNKKVIRPGAAQFAPAATGVSGFSFTFATRRGTSNCTPYTVQWRSPRGTAAHLASADMVVTYRRSPNNRTICEY